MFVNLSMKCYTC